MITSSFSRLAIGTALVCVAVSGCATTPKGWRKKEPIIDVPSAKSVDEVIRCVSDLWQSKGLTLSYLPRSNGGTITSGSNDVVVNMLDVDKVSSGSRIRYYGVKSIWSKANAKEKAEIETCL